MLADDEISIGLDKNVKLFLDGLQLEEYYDNFRKHQIDFDLFFTLTNEDLKSIGIENAEHRKDLMRVAKKPSPDLDESIRSLKKEEADAILTNSYKYLTVLKVYLKEFDPTRARHKIRNTPLDSENSAADGIVTFSNAAIKCIQDLRAQYSALLGNELPKKSRKKSLWSAQNIPVFTVLLSGMLVSGFLLRKMLKPC